MRPEPVVRLDGLGHQIGPLRLDPLIDDLSEIAVGPAIEAALLDTGHVVGDQIIAQHVALVDRGPQGAGDRLERHAVGVPQPGSVEPQSTVGGIDLENGGAVDLGLHAVLGDVAVGA